MSDNDDTIVSTTDAIGIVRNYDRPIRRNVIATSAPKVLEIDQDAECYKMNHRNRGHAVIFNHHIFDFDKTKRKGTMKDSQDLKQVLEDLKFKVTTHHDLKYVQIIDVIVSLAKGDHSNSDCLMVIILSHGDKGVILARDIPYEPDKLWKPFAGDRCPTLAGKPKLFFIQACRGDELDGGINIRSPIQHDAPTSPNMYTIPVMADILVMYSSYDGFYSFRNPEVGSWLIQCLCAKLKEHARDRDLLTILTFVNRKMAVNYESCSGEKAFHAKKQIGTVVSTLTRLLYFHDDKK